MTFTLARRHFLKGTIGLATSLAMPTLAKTGTDRISIGYFIPNADQIQQPARLSWIAPANMVGMCLEPLVRIGGENHIEYVLATKIASNASGKLWSITLRQDVMWQGPGRSESLKAEHVVANIRHWIDDEKSALGGQFRDFVANVRADNGQVLIELKKANFQFFYVFTSYAALIMHPDDGWTFSNQSRRTGPFRMLSYESMKSAHFVPEENYWNAAQKAQLPVVFIQDQGASDANFDFIPQFDPDRGPQLIAKGIKIKQNALADSLTFHMDCQTEILQDVAVRQALKACLDPNRIIASLYGYARVGDHSHSSPIHQDYPKGQALLPSYQPAKAKALLDGREVSLPLHYIADNVWQRNAVQSYAEQAHEVGIEIIPTPIERDTFDNKWDTFPGLTALKWLHRPLAMQLYRDVYYSSAEWNLSSWKNDTFDHYVDDLYATPLDQTRLISETMIKARKLLHEEGPIVHAAWLDCNKAYNPSRLEMASVAVGSGGHIYANLLRTT